MPLPDVSIDDLAGQITGELLHSRIVLLRGLPGSGRSRVVARVARRLSSSDDAAAVVVGPGAGIGPDQVTARIHRQLENQATVAVLLDDWDRTLRSTSGPELQARLVATCVDGTRAASLGVLMTAGVNDNLSRLSLPGSPLVDAAHTVVHPPILSEQQILDGLAQAGLPADQARTELTDWGAYALARTPGAGTGTFDAETTVRDIAASVGPDHARRLLDLLRRDGLRLAEDPLDRVLAPAVHRTADGRVRLPAFLHRSGLATLLVGGTATWPGGRAPSLRRLAARLHRVDDAIWFDRYLPTALPQLTGFLDELTPQVAPLSLRLLGSGTSLGRLAGAHVAEFRAHLPKWRQSGFHVRAHLIDPADYGPLHDRQLGSQQRVEGFHLPPADRIVGRVPVGNETDAYIPRAPMPLLSAAWERSTCWVCDHGWDP